MTSLVNYTTVSSLNDLFYSNQSEKEHIFQSSTSIKDDPQFFVQLADNHLTRSDTHEGHQRKQALSVEDMFVQASLLAPGTKIPPKEAKQVGVTFTAK